MRLIRLQAKDVLRLEAVDITPEGNLCIIGGQNAQGKSSVLTAIACALAGKSAFPEVPVRRGKKVAEIVVDLGDLIVTRQIDAKGTTRLVVAGPDGAPKRSPQSLLDALVGRLTFDPLEFSRMQPKAQAETLRELMGLDFSALDAKREAAYEQRRDEGREVKALAAQIDAIPEDADAPAEPVDVAALADTLNAAVERNHANEQARNDLTATRQQHVDLLAKVEAARDELARLEALVGLSFAAGKRLAKHVKALEDVDAAPIREQLAGAEAVNAHVRAQVERGNLEVKHAEAKARVQKLADEIERIDATKAEQLAKAGPPVPGLAFDETGVTLNGLPFSQASDAEKLRTSIAMGFAANPELRILLIRDGSLLDDESLRLVAEMADERDGQVFLERVGEGDECQVIIEDGRVKGADA